MQERRSQERRSQEGGNRWLLLPPPTDSSLSWTVDHEAALVSAFRQERQALWPGCGPAPGALCSPADRAAAAQVLALSARLGLPEGQMRGTVRDYLRGRLTAIREKGRPAPVSLAYFQAALCEHLTTCTGGDGWSAAAAAAPHSPRRKAPATVTGAEADRIILTTLGLWPED
ncbi:hypothetical protein [Novispirillum itersonii]|uniref:hypothetical protein n=1 Tax=Novispirillum itersonii TaxID=189 RepID=UPI000367D5B1|nr:hypothetical protein [Novispirillum itersonii]